MGARTEKPTVIDLFCGCGGLSLGFADAGFDVVLGVDHDEAALRTHKENLDTGAVSNIDLSRKDADKKIIRLLRGKSVDVIAAGPPCQGFSLTGPRNFDDDRNRLYLSVIRMVGALKPKAFLIENVPGLVTLYGGRIRDEIIRRFDAIGYTVNDQVLCAADYGVPQLRRRVFFVGLRKEFGRFMFPIRSHQPENYVTCEEAIGDLPSREHDLGKEFDEYDGDPRTRYQKIMRDGCVKLYNHVATRHTDLVKGVISLVPEGGNYKDLPPGVGESRRFNEAWTRYHSGKPSRTIDTGHRNHFHYKYHRVPTIRENARLQSFPDWFVFHGTRTQQNKHVGNAVPPLLAFHVAGKIMDHIGAKRITREKSVLTMVEISAVRGANIPLKPELNCGG